MKGKRITYKYIKVGETSFTTSVVNMQGIILDKVLAENTLEAIVTHYLVQNTKLPEYPLHLVEPKDIICVE